MAADLFPNSLPIDKKNIYIFFPIKINHKNCCFCPVDFQNSTLWSYICRYSSD